MSYNIEELIQRLVELRATDVVAVIRKALAFKEQAQQQAATRERSQIRTIERAAEQMAQAKTPTQGVFATFQDRETALEAERRSCVAHLVGEIRADVLRQRKDAAARIVTAFLAAKAKHEANRAEAKKRWLGGPAIDPAAWLMLQGRYGSWSIDKATEYVAACVDTGDIAAVLRFADAFSMRLAYFVQPTPARAHREPPRSSGGVLEAERAKALSLQAFLERFQRDNEPADLRREERICELFEPAFRALFGYTPDSNRKTPGSWSKPRDPWVVRDTWPLGELGEGVPARPDLTGERVGARPEARR